MAYFRLDTLGDLNVSGICFIDNPGTELGAKHYCPTLGQPVASYYPDEMKMYLEKESPGTKLTSLLGNSERYLLCHRTMKEMIEGICSAIECEYLPFTLYNHKKREHSRDYFIVNPIGTFDCIDFEASGATYSKKGTVSLPRLVFDRSKLNKAPDLFRPDKSPENYIISSRLKDELEKNDFTNIVVTEVALAK
jgi:hypothetical protein